MHRLQTAVSTTGRRTINLLGSPHDTDNRTLVMLARVHGIPDRGNQAETSENDTGIVHTGRRDGNRGGCVSMMAVQLRATHACKSR